MNSHVFPQAQDKECGRMDLWKPESSCLSRWMLRRGDKWLHPGMSVKNTKSNRPPMSWFRRACPCMWNVSQVSKETFVKGGQGKPRPKERSSILSLRLTKKREDRSSSAESDLHAKCPQADPAVALATRWETARMLVTLLFSAQFSLQLQQEDNLEIFWY